MLNLHNAEDRQNSRKTWNIC